MELQEVFKQEIVDDVEITASPALPSSPVANRPDSLFDSARGSSVKSELDGMRPGELFWAQFQRYCGWPCILYPNNYEGDNSAVNKLDNLKATIRFFGDNGRFANLAPKFLTPFASVTNESMLARTFRKGSKSTAALPSSVKPKWDTAVQEAKTIYAFPVDERIKNFEETLIAAREETKRQRKPVLKIKTEPDENACSSRDIDEAAKLKQFEDSIIGFVTLRLKNGDNVDQVKQYVPMLWKIRKECEEILGKGNLASRAVIRRINNDFNAQVEHFAENNNASTSVSIKTVKSEARPFKKKEEGRPIAEVIDDIYTLELNCLQRDIRGVKKCKYCLNISSINLQACIDCANYFHSACMRSVSVHNKMRCIKTNSVVTDAMGEIPPSSQRCHECECFVKGACSICFDLENNGELLTCQKLNCKRKFHVKCTGIWPQGSNTQQSALCPVHKCHTCYGKSCLSKRNDVTNIKKLITCALCPATYHNDIFCVPAGSSILTNKSLICPRHNAHKSDSPVNQNWCFQCYRYGSLVCCETCPRSVTKENNKTGDGIICKGIDDFEDEDGYLCKVCLSGLLPVFGEIVWVKYRSYRWWPSIILPPSEIPDNIRQMKHGPFEFVVRFFGSNDHAWTTRRRVITFEDDDIMEKIVAKNQLDQKYKNGVNEAKSFLKIIKIRRASNIKFAKSAPYDHIIANRIVAPVKLKPMKLSACLCNPNMSNPCGPDSSCLSRAVNHECDPEECPAGPACENRQFERRVNIVTEVMDVGGRGSGLVTRQFIPKGNFITEYVGEVINDAMLQKRMERMEKDCAKHYYFFTVKKDYTIDAGPCGNYSRFVNHSCDPNCETQKWIVGGITRIGIFARKDIEPGTELTFNYGWSAKTPKTCLCGASNCNGVIGTVPSQKAKKDSTDKMPRSNKRPRTPIKDKKSKKKRSN